MKEEHYDEIFIKKGYKGRAIERNMNKLCNVQFFIICSVNFLHLSRVLWHRYPPTLYTSLDLTTLRPGYKTPRVGHGPRTPDPGLGRVTDPRPRVLTATTSREGFVRLHVFIPLVRRTESDLTRHRTL